MNQKELTRWLRIGIAGVCIIMLVSFIIVIPGAIFRRADEELMIARYRTLIIILSEIAIIPCIYALIRAWCVTDEIAKDNSFSKENVMNMKQIGLCALIESIYLFIFCIVMAILNHFCFEEFALYSFVLALISCTIFVAAVCLAHLIDKAAAIKAENDSIV